MQIYDDKKKRIGTLTGFKGRAITKTLDSGDKELTFEYPANGVMADLLKEEYYIRTKEDEFVLKAVEAGEQCNKYTATLNVEELEGQSFPYGFASQEQTIKACLTFAFESTGWTIGTCTVTKRRTIDIEEATTAWGVLQSCLSTYRCECEIDTLQKRINIYAQIGRDRGCYFVEGLNLRKLTATSDTYEFYTRIIPIGKDGITIEWLHGKEYLENYQYSSKAKTYTWKDERYTNTTSLMEDAEAKLEELSKPYKVYAADVVDLAKANPEYKNILDFGIGDTVMMVSKHPRMREKQRIVKIVEYPETPEKNTVELSNTTKTFAEVQKTETELAKTEAISIANSTTKKVLQDYSTTEEVETKITASKESIELGVMHTLESYYDKTETDARIEISKGEIELGVSKTYQTKEGMSDYSTTEETKALIDIEADRINTIVSKKTGEDEVKSIIEQQSESIRLQAKKISWDSEYSSMTETGELTCTKGVFKGDISSESGNSTTTIKNGELKISYSDSVYTSIRANKDGYGSDFDTYGTANKVWQEFRVNGTRLLSLGQEGQGIFQKPSAYFPDGIYAPADMYANTIYLNTRGNGGYLNGTSSVIVCHANFNAQGTISCSGTKSRISKTKNYGDRLLYCYEMSTPMFGDIGYGKTDGEGMCIVSIDDVMAETVSESMKYHVFLQSEGRKELWVENKQAGFFIVKGEPETEFSWEIKAAQREYTIERLEEYSETKGLDFDGELQDEENKQINEIILLEQEMEELLWKSN